jgi:hypothetical protein
VNAQIFGCGGCSTAVTKEVIMMNTSSSRRSSRSPLAVVILALAFGVACDMGSPTAPSGVVQTPVPVTTTPTTPTGAFTWTLFEGNPSCISTADHQCPPSREIATSTGGRDLVLMTNTSYKIQIEVMTPLPADSRVVFRHENNLTSSVSAQTQEWYRAPISIGWPFTPMEYPTTGQIALTLKLDAGGMTGGITDVINVTTICKPNGCP